MNDIKNNIKFYVIILVWCLSSAKKFLSLESLYHMFVLVIELYLPEQCYGDELADDDEDLYEDDGTDRQHLITYVPPTAAAASANPTDRIVSIGSDTVPIQTSAEPTRAPVSTCLE